MLFFLRERRLRLGRLLGFLVGCFVFMVESFQRNYEQNRCRVLSPVRNLPADSRFATNFYDWVLNNGWFAGQLAVFLLNHIARLLQLIRDTSRSHIERDSAADMPCIGDT